MITQKLSSIYSFSVTEISYVYKDYMVYDCPGYWDTNLQFHEGHYFPQYCMLMDLLNMPDLKQPEL